MLPKGVKPTISLRLKITDVCNFSCYFCHKEGDKDGKVMTANDVRVLNRCIKDEKYIRKIGLTGGEPLLNPNLIEILDVLRGTGTPVKITTNGSLLDKWIDKLKVRGVEVNVSLHSIDPVDFKKTTGVNAIKKVLRNIKLANRAGILNKINIAVTKYNEKDLPSVLNWLDRNVRGVEVSIFNLVGDDPIRVKGQWEYITPEIKEAQQIFNFCEGCPLLKKCEGCESIRVSKSEDGFVVFVCPLGKEPRFNVATEDDLKLAIQTIWGDAV